MFRCVERVLDKLNGCQRVEGVRDVSEFGLEALKGAQGVLKRVKY